MLIKNHAIWLSESEVWPCLSQTRESGLSFFCATFSNLTSQTFPKFQSDWLKPKSGMPGSTCPEPRKRTKPSCFYRCFVRRKKSTSWFREILRLKKQSLPKYRVCFNLKRFLKNPNDNFFQEISGNPTFGFFCLNMDKNEFFLNVLMDYKFFATSILENLLTNEQTRTYVLPTCTKIQWPNFF